jgi:CheY-like chemotaxis protein
MISSQLRLRKIGKMILFSPQNQESTRRMERKKPLVLLADATRDNREFLRILMEMYGFSVIEAEDGTQAISLAKEKIPDLILINDALPVIDGFRATRRIRLLGSQFRMPIIFLACDGHLRHQSAARMAGCSEYIVQPLDIDQLRRVIERYFLFNGEFFYDGNNLYRPDKE